MILIEDDMATLRWNLNKTLFFCSGLGAGVAYLISNFGYSENYSQLAGDAHYSICPIFGFCSFSRSWRFCNQLSVAIFLGIRPG